MSVGALLVCAGGIWLAAACSDDDQADAASAIERFVVALEGTIDLDCECQQASSDVCASAKQSLRRCVDDAVAADPLVSRQFPRCAVQATRDYNACVRARGSCGEDGIQGVEACVAAIEAVACEIPASVQSCLAGVTST